MTPSRLFKYQPFNTQTLANLTQRALWFSDPVDFNDPYDCRLDILDDSISPSEAQAAYEKMHAAAADPEAFAAQYVTDGRLNETFTSELRKGLNGEFATILSTRRGIACFAARWDNLLMWAHYADGHRGFCLEFDTSDEMFSKARAVRYEDQVPRLKAVDLFLRRETPDLIDSTLATKSAHWMYEQEWRIIHTDTRLAYTYPWQILKRVYLGAAMPDIHAIMIALILQGSQTELYRVTKATKGFGLEAAQVTYKPFDYKAEPSNQRL